MGDFKIPTEIIDLPSKGYLYPEENPLSEGKVEMKYMTAKEEDILTNVNYIRQGIVTDKLLQSLIISKIKYGDLIVGDRNAIFIAARILGYGKEYTFTYTDKNGNERTVTIDLTTIKDKPLDESIIVKKGLNEFNYKFPLTDNEITFKFLTHADETAIEKDIEGLKKIDPNSSSDITTRLSYIITSINGIRDKGTIRKFINEGLLAKDSLAFRRYYNAVSPGIDLKYIPDDGEEAITIPIGVNFFWPDTRV